MVTLNKVFCSIVLGMNVVSFYLDVYRPQPHYWLALLNGVSILVMLGCLHYWFIGRPKQEAELAELNARIKATWDSIEELSTRR